MSKLMLLLSLVTLVASCSVKVTRDNTGNVVPVGGTSFIKTFSKDAYAPIARQVPGPSIDTTTRKKDKEDAFVFQVP